MNHEVKSAERVLDLLEYLAGCSEPVQLKEIVAVLGFPSNDFGEQEPGTAEEIATFCKRTYDVTFPMFSKVVTRPGREQSPIYSYLGTTGHLPAWNFAKYVVGKDGRVRAFFPSEVTPEDPRLRRAIADAMAEK